MCAPLKCWVSRFCDVGSCYQIEVALAAGQCIHSVCNTLAMWERMGKYFEYVEFLHRQLLPTIRSAYRTDVDDRQWRQLIVVAIVFCLNYIEVRALGFACAVLSLAVPQVDASWHTRFGLSVERSWCGTGGQVCQGAGHASSSRAAAGRRRRYRSHGCEGVAGSARRRLRLLLLPPRKVSESDVCAR